MDSDREERCNDLLTHESEQLHENIQRTLGDMHSLSTIVFPILTGAFVLVLEGKVGKTVDERLLCALFAVTGGLVVTAFNNAWMQLTAFMRFKYVEVLPRLYVLSRRGGRNFGQFSVGGGMLRPMVGVVLIQAILVPTTVVATWLGMGSGLFSVAAVISAALAVLTSIFSWTVAVAGIRAVKDSIALPHPDPVDPATPKAKPS